MPEQEQNTLAAFVVPEESAAIEYQCTNDEYHADKTAVSHSQAEVLIRESAPMFHGRCITGEFPRKVAKTLDLGTVVHDVLLEDGDCWRMIPEDALNAQGHRKGKAWLQYKEENAGKILLTQAESVPLMNMIASVRGHHDAMDLLDSPGPNELSLWWVDDTGLHLRARLDHLADRDNGSIIVDVKSTKATNDREFSSDMAKFGYHRQAWWYKNGGARLPRVDEVVGFAFVCVQNVPPYACFVREPHPNAMELAARQCRAAIDELARRFEQNDWHLADNGKVKTLDLPYWAYKDQEWEISDD